MVFGIFVILLVLLVAYFHYTQGFFSATLSAIITVLAAVLAVSYHETVVNALLKGKMADMAHSMVLCMIFAVTYIALRVAFDAAIPGNVRTPGTIDKIGAGLMGLVSGVFAVGVFALAAQMLPFGPTISFMGYSRYPVKDNPSVVVDRTSNQSKLDSHMNDEFQENNMTGEAGDRAKQTGLLLPVDDWLLDTVYHLSDGGSLAGARTLASVHPDYLQELFGERLGQQDGGRRSALFYNGNESLSVTGAFTTDQLATANSLPKDTRPAYKFPAEYKSSAAQKILVVRVLVKVASTDDSDRIFRFSTGSVRLTYKEKDYYPVGTLEGTKTVLVNKPDDFLFLNLNNGDTAFDAVFMVDGDVFSGSSEKLEISKGAFITVKRLAVLDLSGTPVGTSITSDPTVEVMRNVVIIEDMKLPPHSARVEAAKEAPAPAPTSAGPSTPAASPTKSPTAEAPKAEMSASGSATAGIGFTIAGSPSGNDDPNVSVAGGTVGLSAGTVATAQIDPISSTALSTGSTALHDFAEPAGFKMVQVNYENPADPFAWVSQANAIVVVDSNGNSYRICGAIVTFNQGGEDKVMVRYNWKGSSVSLPSLGSVTPKGSTLLFLVPTSTKLTSLKVGAQSGTINVDVQ